MSKKKSDEDKAIQANTNKLIAYDDEATFIGEIQGLHNIVDAMIAADDDTEDPRTGMILRLMKDMALMTLHVRLLLDRMKTQIRNEEDVNYTGPDWEEYMRNFNKEPDDEESTS